MLIRFYNFRLFLARWSGKFQKQFASFDPKKLYIRPILFGLFESPM